MAYSPDGRLIAVSGTGYVAGGGGVVVYTTSGLPLWCPPTSTNYGPQVAFSPDGDTLVVAGSYGGNVPIIELWSIRSRKLLFSLPTSSTTDFSVAFSRDGSTLLVAGNTFEKGNPYSLALIEEWHVATGKLLRSVKQANMDLFSAAYSADGKTFAVGGANATGAMVELWNTAKGTLQATMTAPRTMQIATALAFSPDGKTIACGCSAAGSLYGATIELFSTVTQTDIGSFTGGGGTRVTCVAYSPDGKLLATAGASLSIGDGQYVSYGSEELRDPQGNLIKILGGGLGSADMVAFSRDGSSFAQIQADQTGGHLNIWNVEAQTVQFTISTGTAAQTPVAGFWNLFASGSASFSPSGKLVAGGPLLQTSSPIDGVLEQVPVWDAETGTPTAGLSTAVNDGKYSDEFSPDGRLLAVAGTHYGQPSKGVLELWNPSKTSLIASLPTSVVYNGIVAFSPDGKVIACGGSTATGSYIIELWDVATHKRTQTLTSAVTGALMDLAFTPDGKQVIDCGHVKSTSPVPGIVEVWNVATGQLSASLPTSEIDVDSVAVSPDGKNLAVGGDQVVMMAFPRIEIWSLSSDKLITTLPATSTINIGSIERMRYSKDGDTLVACGYYGILEFNTNTGKLNGVLDTGDQQISSLSADCRLGASITYYGNLVVSNIPPAVSAPIASVTFNAPSVFNGTAITGTVTLTELAPEGGVTVGLQSSYSIWIYPPFSIPASVTIPAGRRSASFSAITPLVTSPMAITISAWCGAYKGSGSFTVLCPNVTSITLSSTSVQGGASLVATVTIDRPAGTISPDLTVTSDHPAVVIPGNAYFPYGKTSTTVNIATSAVTSQKIVTITAKCGSTTKSVQLTVHP